MSKNHEKKIIVDFLDHYFQTRKFQFPKSDISQNEKLIRLGILREIDGSSEIVRIEEYSTTLQEVVLELATIKLKKELPNNVSEGFEFIDEFNDAIKEEYDYQRVLSPFSLLIRGLRGYVIYLLHKRGLDVKTFYCPSTLVTMMI